MIPNKGWSTQPHQNTRTQVRNKHNIEQATTTKTHRMTATQSKLRDTCQQNNHQQTEIHQHDIVTKIELKDHS